MPLSPRISRAFHKRRKSDATIESSRWTAPAHQNHAFADDYPIFPPPDPESILRNAPRYLRKVQARKFPFPLGESIDTPLFALYRLYEAFVLDQKPSYRQIMEGFWSNSSWPVADIPDPDRSEPKRYAFLAAVTYIMARSFNTRVMEGQTRGAGERMEVDAANVEEEAYEYPPEWAEWVTPLAQTLCMPTKSGIYLASKEDQRADEDFLGKNILMWSPDVYFP